MDKLPIGRIQWQDLTVANAAEVRDFYQSVIGWTVTNVEMGGYSDYCMQSPDDDEAVAGVCHSRGANAELPPLWIVYINVADLEHSLKQVVAKGGRLRSHVKSSPQGSYCLIEDPAGAVAALYQPGPGKSDTDQTSV